MKVMILLIAISLSLALIFLLLFFMAVKNGQFDDLDSPSFRLLKNKKTKSSISKVKLNNKHNAKRTI
jgi:cbb3-type cytochrome oxidase maturation protein